MRSSATDVILAFGKVSVISLNKISGLGIVIGPMFALLLIICFNNSLEII